MKEALLAIGAAFIGGVIVGAMCFGKGLVINVSDEPTDRVSGLSPREIFLAHWAKLIELYGAPEATRFELSMKAKPNQVSLYLYESSPYVVIGQGSGIIYFHLKGDRVIVSERFGTVPQYLSSRDPLGSYCNLTGLKIFEEQSNA